MEVPEEKVLSERLAELDNERSKAKDQLNRERLTRVTNDTLRTITSPEFMERLHKSRIAAESGEGMAAAAHLLSIEGLREAGVDIPDDFRVTSRVFEDRETGVRLKIDEGFPDRPGGLDPDALVLGWGACAGGGGLTFCGCGGFST